jgi:hypothetical protein
MMSQYTLKKIIKLSTNFFGGPHFVRFLNVGTILPQKDWYPKSKKGFNTPHIELIIQQK